MQKKLRVWRGISRVPEPFPCVVSFGNFDGVHVGHQKIIALARAEADRLALPLVVITFWPITVVALKSKQDQVLQNVAQKVQALGMLGVDHVILQSFNQRFKSISAESYLEMIFTRYLQAKAVVVGEDCHYGQFGRGNLESLRHTASQLGIVCHGVDFYLDSDCLKVGSGRIRAYLANNQLSLANDQLGHSFAVRGVVQHGLKLGRQLGYPTLNIAAQRQAGLLTGVFAVEVLYHGVWHPGVASWGYRPVLDGAHAKLLEVHLFEFDDDIYHQLVTVSFKKFIRPELPFEDLAALTKQIKQDIRDAKDFLGH